MIGSAHSHASVGAAPPPTDPVELEHVIGFNGRYSNTLHYHPVEKDTLIFSIGGYVVIENLHDRHKQEFLKGHDMELSALTVSNTGIYAIITLGTYIASGQIGTEFQKLPEAPVILWDFATRQARFALKGLKLKVKMLAFSPDDAFLAAVGENNAVIIWDTKTGLPVYTKYSEFPVLQGKDIMRIVCWGPMYGGGGTKHPGYVIVTMTRQQVNINQLDFDIASMQYYFKAGTCQLPSTGESPFTAGLVRDYTHSILGDDSILVGTQGGEICIFSISSRVYKGSLPLSSNGLYTLVKMDNFLFIGGGDGRVKKLDLISGKWNLTHEAQLEGKVTSLSLSTDRKEVLAGTSTDRIYRLLTTDLSYLVHTQAHDGSVNDISFSSSRSDQFCCIDSAGACKVWDSSEYKCVFNVKHPKLYPGRSCTILNDNTIMTGWDDGFVRCYEPTQGALIWEIANAHKGPVTAVYGDKNYLLTGGAEGAVRVWARTNRQLLIQFQEHSKDVIGLFPDIKQVHLIHSASVDRSIATYDLKLERKLVGHQTANGVLCGLSQRKDHEEELVTCGHGAPIYFWDIDEQHPVAKIEVGPIKMTAIAVSPSGKWMAVGSETSEVSVYNIENFEGMFKISSHTGHSSPVMKIKWTPDEKQIISASSDESICVWNFYG